MRVNALRTKSFEKCQTLGLESSHLVLLLMSQAPDGDDQMRQGLDPGIAVFLILDDLQTGNKASKTKPKLGLKI